MPKWRVEVFIIDDVFAGLIAEQPCRGGIGEKQLAVLGDQHGVAAVFERQAHLVRNALQLAP